QSDCSVGCCHPCGAWGACRCCHPIGACGPCAACGICCTPGCPHPGSVCGACIGCGGGSFHPRGIFGRPALPCPSRTACLDCIACMACCICAPACPRIAGTPAIAIAGLCAADGCRRRPAHSSTSASTPNASAPP